MANQEMLTFTVETRDPKSVYGYHADSRVALAQNAGTKIHMIWGTQATPGTDHASAPAGSIYVYMHATAPQFYVKAGAFNETSGNWVEIT